ncbi:DUF4396 domain-containing protein [Novosphingobium beihaiensis]|uniref:DUF4396 domain-containing protein n=1 Tax=Novosphingobium beihaiensis TaxID=2930389 RepID=A0ABT0BP93_9SPHN|nr:DUF4396 domain-containing protein [Novosphingobium beihaiensis]MCJ2186765.1 DUF4396 domain-containing protein [Novosphingobium beihaiensis]
MFSALFHDLATLSLCVGFASAVWMLATVLRHPPHMKVMAWVWPLCALFLGPLLILFHARHGGHGHASSGKPRAATIAKGTLHCGAGCALADMIAETLALLFPALLTVFGLHWLFAERIFAAWVFDFLLALSFGIAFQYFAIAPMRGLGLTDGLREAAKADTLSLTCWQIGMYGFMAMAHFWFFPHILGRTFDAATPEFWFAMQGAMIAGFITAFPINRWLIARGIKEAM